VPCSTYRRKTKRDCSLLPFRSLSLYYPRTISANTAAARGLFRSTIFISVSSSAFCAEGRVSGTTSKCRCTTLDHSTTVVVTYEENHSRWEGEHKASYDIGCGRFRVVVPGSSQMFALLFPSPNTTSHICWGYDRVLPRLNLCILVPFNWSGR